MREREKERDGVTEMTLFQNGSWIKRNIKGVIKNKRKKEERETERQIQTRVAGQKGRID